MGKSSHKNFIEGYGRNRDILIEDQIIPYQNAIFNLFNIKFESDAKKDGIKGRKKLEYLGFKCSNNCKKIHQILVSNNDSFDEYENIIETINNIVNMDYGNLQNFFNTLKSKYKDIPQIYKLLDETNNYIGEMWKISKSHTNIISQ